MCGANAGTETGLLNHILAEHLERACGMCTQFKTTSNSAKDENSLLDHIRLKCRLSWVTPHNLLIFIVFVKIAHRKLLFVCGKSIELVC